MKESAAAAMNNDPYKGANRAITEMSDRLVDLKREKKSLEESGYGLGFKNYDETIRGIAELESRLKEYKAQLTQPMSVTVDTGNLNSQLKEAQQNLKSLERAGFGLGDANYDAQVQEVARLTEAVKQYKKELLDEDPPNRFKEALKKIGEAAKAAAGKFFGLNKGSKGIGTNITGGIRQGIKSLLKYGFAIRSTYVLVNKLKSFTAEGLKNLVQFSSGLNGAASSMMSSLTQLKNSLATATAPILEVIAPHITSLINMFSGAMTSVSAFMSAITGKSTYTRAVAVSQDYAASLKGASSAAKDAADKQKELNRQLMGFDEINKLNDSTGSGSGAGAGSGAGGGNSLTPGMMFVTEEIPGLISGWADKVKEAWANADFTEIGTIFGTKLKNALDNIPWDGIKSTLERIAKSAATFLNGFLEVPGLWQTVGNTVGEGFNIALNTLNTFAEAFHWTSLGKAISDGIQSALDKFDWSQITRGLSNIQKALAGAAAGLIEGVDWQGVPKGIFTAIKEAISGFDWKGMFSASTELLGAATGAVLALCKGIIDAIADVNDDLERNGKDIMLGILNGIAAAITGIPKWVTDNILTPFINGFKSAFGIASPAKNKALLEAAGYVGEGILNGIAAPFKAVGAWVNEHILQPIKDVLSGKIDLGEVALNVKANVTSFADKIKSKTVDKFKANLTSKGDKIKKKTLSGFVANLTKPVDKIKQAKKELKNFTAVVYRVKSGKGWISINGGARAMGGMYRNGQWSPIQQYAAGGLPDQGQMFIARERGPELVGQIGTGTAVVNNEQIVASVSEGVYRAVMAAMGAGRQNDVSVTVNVDGKALGPAVVHWLADQSRQGAFPLAGLV